MAEPTTLQRCPWRRQSGEWDTILSGVQLPREYRFGELTRSWVVATTAFFTTRFDALFV